ncbi:MAG: DUF4105 domain-containing protein [Bacteroidota bacterium]
MKKILLRSFFVCILAHLHVATFAQDSSHLRISLLTCTPGEELYSTFGHTAIRVTDSSLSFNDENRDIVYNYGTFNFDDDGFYLKFIKGKLLYYISQENFEDVIVGDSIQYGFKHQYEYTNRGITEQVLNFSPVEKINIQHALKENIKEENKYYKYDFFFDNCTTRPRDMIVKYKIDPITFKAVMPAGTTFRDAIHQYLDKNNKHWSKLGIDLLLGQPCDGVMTTTQSQFLPDNLMKTLDSSNLDHSLVLSEKNLYPIEDTSSKMDLFTPLVIFSILLLTIILISFKNTTWAIRFLQGFDGLFFFLTGAIGIVLLFMWNATDHAMCRNNYNLLWALPTHVILAFFVRSRKSWVKKYYLITAILSLILLLAWFFLPQQMNDAFIPIVLLLTFRSYRIYAN